MKRDHKSVIRKKSARGLVRNRSGQLLLLRWRDPETRREVWEVPGGSTEGDETLEDALLRELREETGYVDISIRQPIWRRDHPFTWAGQSYMTDEVFYVCDLLSDNQVPTSHDEVEAAGFVESRWWSPAELPDYDQCFIPAGLGSLWKGYLENGSDEVIDISL